MAIDKLISEGKQHFEAEAYEQALSNFKKVVSKDKKHEEGRYFLALTYGKLNDYESSHQLLTALIEDFPENPDYFSHRGVLHFNHGYAKLALQDLDQSLSLEPDHGYRYSSRAFVKDKTGDTEGAIGDYKMAIEIDPEDEISKNNLELAQEKLQYKQESASKQPKTKDHYSDEEIAEYRKQFEQRNGKEAEQDVGEKQPDQQVQDVSVGHLLNEMAGVFTSRQKMGEFFSFVKNGFRHPS